MPFMPSNICWKNQFCRKNEFWKKFAQQLLDCLIFRLRIMMSIITQMLLRWVNLRLVLWVNETIFIETFEEYVSPSGLVVLVLYEILSQPALMSNAYF